MVLLSTLLLLLLAACGPEAWERDPQVQTAKRVCKGLDEGERYDCIERHAVESLNPAICRLAGIWIDDMCLQAVYEAADDPAICEQIYLEGVRPTCHAYYRRPAADWTVDTVLSVAGEPGHQVIAAQVVVTHQGNRPVEDLGAWLVFPRAEGLPAEAELKSMESAPPGPLTPNHARIYATEIGWQTDLGKEEISAILDHAQIRLAWTVDGERQEDIFPLPTGDGPPALPAAAGTDPAEVPQEPAPSLSPVATARPDRSAGAPAWHHILFVWNHDGAAELWTLDPVSSAVQRQIRPGHTVQDPALSASGDTIAYVRVTGDYGGIVSELWLMDRDGANPRPLYIPPPGQSVLSRPAWSPGDEEIYFLQHGAGTDSQLLRVSVTEEEPTIVLTDCIDFALSPGGQWLVSVSLGRELTISGPDGTRLRDLIPQGTAFADYYSLAASPDGDLLAFRAVEAGGEDTWNLYVMEWDGRNVHRLTDLKGFQQSTTSTGQVNGLAWTADGAQLVYSVDGHPQQSGIWRIGLDGVESRRLFTWQEGEWAAVRGPWFEPVD
jgi:Tol biopolymer transport system component